MPAGRFGAGRAAFVVAIVLGGVVAVGLFGQARPASLGGGVADRLEAAPATRIGDAAAMLTTSALTATPKPFVQGPPRWMTGRRPASGHPLPVKTKRLLGLNWQVDPYQT